MLGIDLSRTTDLTAVMWLVQKKGVINIFGKFFLPAEKIQEATDRDGLPYEIYIQKGFLVPSGDNVIDYRDCHLYPLRVLYDRYSSQYLIRELESFGCLTDDCHQGFNMTPAIAEFEGMLKDGRVNIGDNDLLKVHLLNAALKMENQSERVKLIKIAQNDHVDGVAAILDAMIGRQKYWAEDGRRLINER